MVAFSLAGQEDMADLGLKSAGASRAPTAAGGGGRSASTARFPGVPPWFGD